MKAIFLAIMVILLLKVGEGVFIGAMVPAMSLITSSILVFATPSFAKQELIKGLMEIDKEIMTDPTGEVNMTDIAMHTYDETLLELYYRTFLGNFSIKKLNNSEIELVDIGKDFSLENLVEVSNQLQQFKGSKNMNLNALRYFLYTQSILINEIDNPYEEEVPTLEQLNFDFQFNQDPEIVHFGKLNYLALMEFWKEYV